eukprot:685231-Karenia_brevis.AAC.1
MDDAAAAASDDDDDDVDNDDDVHLVNSSMCAHEVSMVGKSPASLDYFSDHAVTWNCAESQSFSIWINCAQHRVFQGDDDHDDDDDDDDDND